MTLCGLASREIVAQRRLVPCGGKSVEHRRLLQKALGNLAEGSNVLLWTIC